MPADKKDLSHIKDDSLSPYENQKVRNHLDEWDHIDPEPQFSQFETKVLKAIVKIVGFFVIFATVTGIVSTIIKPFLDGIKLFGGSE